MKKFLVTVGMVAFAVVGCDDSSSASAGQNDGPGVESSSSVEQSSSSSGKAKSSSSKDEKESKASSSSVKLSSSSSVILSASEESSSSSADVQSSSSEIESSSSSSEDKVNCSESLEGETGWSWGVPKECRFNPDIDYGTMTDSRDGKTYKTVKNGEQTWMAENLNYAYSAKTPNLKGKSWCYDNMAKNCDVAGRLYTWAAAMDSVKHATDADDPLDCCYGKTCTLSAKVQGFCPSDWHLPSQTEWNNLITAVGGGFKVGTKLKSRSGWDNFGNGSDSFVFLVLPADLRYENGYIGHDGYDANFWSSTEGCSSTAYLMYLYYNDGDGNLSRSNKNDGYSVRCLRD